MAAVLAPGVQAQADVVRNVLLVIADDLGVDGVGAYGESNLPAGLTPNIDALAARGVLFRNAWANPVCSPTRAAIHTGRHAFRTRVGTWIPAASGGELSLEETTLPEVLTAGGRPAHALIGKWHLTRASAGALAPNDAGWSHFAGLLFGATHYWNWSRTVDGVTANQSHYATTVIVDDALRWIAAQQRGWVCVVSFTAPHAPIHAPPRALHTRNLAGAIVALKPLPFFHAMVEAMDTEFGRLLGALGPELAHTDVIFVGDNGTDGPVVTPPFDRNKAKGTPFEGGLNVPLIVAGPSVGSPGREEAALVSVVDLFATVAELAGVEARAHVPAWRELDSVSLVPYLERAGQEPLRSMVFAERFDGNSWATVHDSGFAAVRDARYKLIRSYTPGSATSDVAFTDSLYDLRDDPFETVDLLTVGLSEDEFAHHRALAQELLRLRSPRQGWFEVSPGCAGSAGDPRLTARGHMQAGGQYVVRLEGAAPGELAVLLTGTSTRTWGALTLPIALGAAGCAIRASGEVALPAVVAEWGGAEVAIAVPPSAEVMDTLLFHGWLCRDPAARDSGWTMSNTGVARIGY